MTVLTIVFLVGIWMVVPAAVVIAASMQSSRLSQLEESMESNRFEVKRQMREARFDEVQPSPPSANFNVARVPVALNKG